MTPPGRDLSYAVVVGIHNVDVALGVHRASKARIIQMGGERRASVSAEPARAVAGHGRDYPGRGDATNSFITEVRYINIASTVYPHSLRVPDSGCRSCPTISRESGHTGASQRRDHTVAGNTPHPAVKGIVEVQHPVVIESHTAGGAIHPRRGGRSIIAGEACGSISGDGADGSGRGDLADAVVLGIRDVKVAGGVHRHPNRCIELGGGCRTAVT